MAETRIRVLIVDDHPVVLEGLRALIASQPDMAVVGEAGTGRDALVQSRLLIPDVTLLDLRLPDAHGAQVITAMTAERPESRVVVVSSYGSDADIHSAIEAGAKGYLLKDSPREELFAAIRCVASGSPFVSPHAASRLVEMWGTDRPTERERKIRILHGILPICSACKDIRDDKGFWNQIEEYIRDHSDVEFSHGICPSCMKKLYPGYHEKQIHEVPLKDSE